MKYLIRIDDLKEKCEYLEKKLQIVHDSIEYMSKMANELIWEGRAYDSFINAYNEHINYLYQTENNLIGILAYLESFYNNSDGVYSDLKMKYQRILNEVK